MFYFSPTLILRHRKENLNKCSLRGLENRKEIQFFTYPQEKLPSLRGYLLLTLEAPILRGVDSFRFDRVKALGIEDLERGHISQSCPLRDLQSASAFTQVKTKEINSPQYILTKEDAHLGILLLDGTWTYAKRMLDQLPKENLPVFRSLPSHIRTAYPRKQTGCPNPEAGLASVEALYVAYKILGRETEGLLDNYYWKEKFLENCSF